MTRWPFKLLLLLLVEVATAALFISPAIASKNQPLQPNYKKTVLTVGYLTAIKGELKDKQGLAISGALTMALDEVRRLWQNTHTDYIHCHSGDGKQKRRR